MDYKKVTHNQQFTDDRTLKSDLWNGDWLNLLVDDMTLSDIWHSIFDTYFLDNVIVSRLVFKYLPNSEQGRGEEHSKYIVDKDERLPSAKRLKSK